MTKRIALVTGASRGIGRAIADGLAASGHCVIGTATTPKGAQAISERFAKAGYEGGGLALNVMDHAAITDCLQTIGDEWGAPQILINNAAVTRDNLILRMQDAEWRDVMSTNLDAIFYLSKACLRAMMKQRWGRIISIGSVVGLSGNAGQANYAAAKAGLIGYTKSLAREVASRGITANVVAPGFIKTDMTDALSDVHQEAILSTVPMKRLGQPDEIAKAVAFLASDAASYITGETLHVNGGMLMD